MILPANSEKMADNHQVQPETTNQTRIAPEGEPAKESSQLFKKRNKKISQSQIRKRTIEPEHVTITNQDDSQTGKEPSAANQNKKLKLAQENQSQQPVVKFNRRKNQRNFNPLYQATVGSTKHSKADQSGSSSEEDEEEDDDEDDLKPRAVGVAYQAQGSARQQAEESYQKAILEKRELDQQAREGFDQDQTELEADTDSKIYLGTSKSKYQLPKGSQKYGPIKGGPNNIKTITVVDYQPDVCKDYKETGYCGFGDTCKVSSIYPLNK